ncbi:MAG TPA: glycosyltransferase family 4 protein [Stellaceae bacterium]|nr:glycosyltransferase family 4 protein [Stellaceae bacterium]
MLGGTNAVADSAGAAPAWAGVPRIVTFTTLFPNAAAPSHGVFVENRLRHLIASGRAAARVVAPVPWFPSGAAMFGDYARFTKAPKREERHGLAIEHPRYPVVPKVGMTAAPLLLFLAALPVLRRLHEVADFDLIDAHYFYPDGVAAALLGRALGKPVVITARGTDINLIPRHRLPRRMIRWAGAQAAGMIAVSEALRRAMIAIGLPAHRIRTLRNGVDLTMFQPTERDATRRILGLNGPTLLSVGHLIERKGHDRVIGALPKLPGFSLLIAGEGPERSHLEAQASMLGVSERVRFLGAIPHAELARIYSAVDALVLASSREGWPNVLLEAMACGTPVVASNVWGAPELVCDPAAGVLMPSLSAQGVVDGVKALFAALPARDATRRFAERYSWDETTAGQVRLFEEVLAARRATKLPPAGALRARAF